jgi:hypothetical protein
MFSDGNQSLHKAYWRTKKMDIKDDLALWPSAQLMEKLRTEFHAKISREQSEHAWQPAALCRAIALLQMDPAAFYRLWIQPLLAAGATLEVAFASIAASHFQPN